MICTQTVNYIWAIPHNLRVAKMFWCYSFVILCIPWVESIKYLLKYGYKSHDRVTIELISKSSNQRYDEVRDFQEAWWPSVTEAHCQHYGSKPIGRTPLVVSLDAPLENCKRQGNQATKRVKSGPKFVEWFEANWKKVCLRDICDVLTFCSSLQGQLHTTVWTSQAAMCINQTERDIDNSKTVQQHNEFTAAGAHVISMLYRQACGREQGYSIWRSADVLMV